MWKTLILTTIFHAKFTQGTQCGTPIGFHTYENKIVGGYDMGFYKYPWYAALIHKNFVECGGALITPKDVLTAAHCFDGAKNKKPNSNEYFNVKLGAYNVCTPEPTQLEFKIEKVKIHELYEKTNPYNDIAIVTLVKSAEKFTPICLPKNFVKKRPKEGLVPGLGTLAYHGATPCTLHEARMLIYPDENCKNILNGVEKNVSNLEKAFCAGYIQGGVDTCQGDSGGPFQIIESDGIYRILGVVSFGYKCAEPGMLGIYTDVSQHLSWIKKHSSGEIPQEIESTSSEKPGNDEMTRPNYLPSISGNPPQQFLQFYPVRTPSIRIQLPPINIFINSKFRKKNTKKMSTKL